MENQELVVRQLELMNARLGLIRSDTLCLFIFAGIPVALWAVGTLLYVLIVLLHMSH